MEAPISASLGAMGSLLGKLDVLLAPEYRLPKEAKDGIQLLRGDLQEIVTSLVDLSEAEDPPLTAKCWMKDVRELSYDMEDYIDELLHSGADAKAGTVRRGGRFKIGRLPWMLKRQPLITNMVSEFRSHVQEAIQRHERYNLGDCISRRRHLSVGPMLPTEYTETDDLFDGPRNELLEWLTNEEEQQLKVVSIVGSGGLGKTTLARKLYHILGGRFDCRAFLHTSQKPDMKRLLGGMLSQLRHHHRPPGACEVPELIHTIRTHLHDKRISMPSGSHTSNLASSGMFARSSAKDGSGSSRASLVKIFSFSDLRLATSNFGPDSVLGRGRFGYVYKGWIDENILSTCKPGTGIAVAVKKLQQEGLLGRRLGEWLEEVNYLGRFCHPNLVKLIGYCLEDEHRLLVQEFMPHGSLERHLLRRDSHFQPLSWNLRMKVALGAAKGLAYLHSAEVQVIYRDFKASSILLDMDFSAKLSNFGLAIGGEKSHVSTREIMGSYGYEAPESISTGRRTAKSNIYSFGVVLLEMLSGRHAIEDYYPVLWARRYLRHKRKISRVMDPNLEGQYPRSGAHTIAALACDCLRVDAEKRPSMDAVVSILEKLQDADLKRAAEKHQESKGA